MKQGGEHWQWSPETPFYIGVLPRRGAKPSDVKVFPQATCFLIPVLTLAPIVVPLQEFLPRAYGQFI